MAKTKADPPADEQPQEAGGLVPNVVRGGIPDAVVIVTEGSTIGHEGQTYTGGDEVTLPGPTANSLALEGAVTIKGDA